MTSIVIRMSGWKSGKALEERYIIEMLIVTWLHLYFDSIAWHCVSWGGLCGKEEAGELLHARECALFGTGRENCTFGADQHE